MTNHSGWAIDCLDAANRTFVVFDEVLAVWSDGERTSCVENDIDDVVVGATRQKSRNEVGIEVGTLDVRM